MRNKIIEPGKLKRVSKSPWVWKIRNRPRMLKESKWAKDAQEERNGTKEPTSNEIGQENTKVA